MNLISFIKSDLPRALFLCAIALAITAGTVHMSLDLNRTWLLRHKVPFSFYGDAFNGLSQALAGERYLGYYTDKDIKDPKYGAQFEQTQFGLVPLVLDRTDISGRPAAETDPGHLAGRRYILFDCRDEQACWRKISELHARPLKRSSLGAVLAITDTP
ncbi:MAG: hypothetical protein HGA80_07295 [Candidatus Omnitrophica bacterium]|nr:hypothetical protein [Candidatus Omnitrophota bacterium]